MKSKYKLSGLGIIIIIIMLIFLNPCIYRAKAADTVRLKNGAMEISSKRLSSVLSGFLHGFLLDIKAIQNMESA